MYYRVHTDSFGWLSWAKNDEITGADCYDIQAVEVRLYLKIDGNKNSLDRSNIHIETGFYKENGYFRLQPENDTMDPIILENVTILGKAIGLYRKF